MEAPNTETTGGTRYSAGKSVQTWLPWRGWELIEWVAVHGGTIAPTDADTAARWAMSEMIECMNEPMRRHDPSADLFLARAGYYAAMSLDILERGGDVTEGVPVLALKSTTAVSVAGAEKYAPLDWDEGQSFSTLLSSAMRHVIEAVAFGADAVNEDDGDQPHLAHALWNIMCALDFVEQGRAEEMDDVTPWRGVTAAEKREAEEVAARTGETVLQVLKRDGAPEAGGPFVLPTVVEGVIGLDGPVYIMGMFDDDPGMDPTELPGWSWVPAGFPDGAGIVTPEELEEALHEEVNRVPSPSLPPSVFDAQDRAQEPRPTVPDFPCLPGVKVVSPDDQDVSFDPVGVTFDFDDGLDREIL